MKHSDYFKETRIHSSRMRTGRSLTVCLSRLLERGPPSRGASFLGWCLPVVGSPFGGAYFLGGCLLLGGPPSWRGLLGRGSPSLGRGLLLTGSPWWGLLLGGLSLAGGSPWQGGASFLVGILGRQPPPVNRITHGCKNITLATTSLRPVNKKITI